MRAQPADFAIIVKHRRQNKRTLPHRTILSNQRTTILQWTGIENLEKALRTYVSNFNNVRMSLERVLVDHLGLAVPVNLRAGAKAQLISYGILPRGT